MIPTESRSGLNHPDEDSSDDYGSLVTNIFLTSPPDKCMQIIWFAIILFWFYMIYGQYTLLASQ